MVDGPGGAESIHDFGKDIVVLCPKCGVAHHLFGLIKMVLAFALEGNLVDACFQDFAETNVVA